MSSIVWKRRCSVLQFPDPPDRPGRRQEVDWRNSSIAVCSYATLELQVRSPSTCSACSTPPSRRRSPRQAPVMRQGDGELPPAGHVLRPVPVDPSGCPSSASPRAFLGKFHVRSVRRALESRTLPLKLVQTLLQVDRFPAFLSQRRVRLQQALIPFGHGRVLRRSCPSRAAMAPCFTNRLFTRCELASSPSNCPLAVQFCLPSRDGPHRPPQHGAAAPRSFGGADRRDQQPPSSSRTQRSIG